jgi:hypothetical protein
MKKIKLFHPEYVHRKRVKVKGTRMFISYIHSSISRVVSEFRYSQGSCFLNRATEVRQMRSQVRNLLVFVCSGKESDFSHFNTGALKIGVNQVLRP